MTAAEVRSAARAYYRDASVLSAQAARQVERLWRQVERGAITASWLDTLPEVVAVVTAAQGVGAELVTPYMGRLSEAQSGGFGDAAGEINTSAFTGTTGDGGDLPDLMYLPAIQAKTLIGEGFPTAGAMAAAGKALTTYAASEVQNAIAHAMSSSMTSHWGVSGYYRMLNPPSCPRCAIQAGEWFRYNQGFKRHPRCDCVHVPAAEVGGYDVRLSPTDAILEGKVTGISKKNLEAVRLGADPGQIINAQAGMRVVGGKQVTTVGTSRRAIAGARMLAKTEARQAGLDVRSMTFDNFSFSRERAAVLTNAFRKGKTYTRVTKSGRTQTYSYRVVNGPRPTAAQIITDAPDRDEAIRLLTNYGYLL